VKPVLVPTTDVNSDKGLVMSWRTENKTRVEVGQPLIDIETSKALIEVDAAHAGFILQAVNAGDTASLAEPIGYVFEELADLERFEAELRKAREEAKLAASTATVRATQQARQRAEELGVDLSWLDTSKLITLKDVEAAAAQLTDYSTMPAPLTGSTGVQRVLLIGGALGATQVLDILQKSEMRKAVAILDDDRSKWGSDLQGVPMIGGTDRLPTLFAEKAFDAAIITIGTSINARVKFRELCAAAGIPLANAIDPTAALLSGVQIGTGNVICAFCHFGNSTVIGDNNFISAHGSFDHHNVIGSDNTTGPSCVTSGLVRIGNRVKMGMGIHLEPRVEIGDDVQIASGAVILRSVPAQHAVKTKIVTTAVVPLRKI
jgi:acetyltransferase-like isoleucine patch superfamily enzyme